MGTQNKSYDYGSKTPRCPDLELLGIILSEIMSSYAMSELKAFKDFEDFWDAVDVQNGYEEDWETSKAGHKPYFEKAYNVILRPYEAKFLSWCKSYKEEVNEFRELIESGPSDVKQLKEEYKQLAGKAFRRTK